MISNIPGLRILQAYDDNPVRVLINYLGRRIFEIGVIDGDPLRAVEYERVLRDLRSAYETAVIDEQVEKAAEELGWHAAQAINAINQGDELAWGGEVGDETEVDATTWICLGPERPQL